jgi:hypothetical protein
LTFRAVSVSGTDAEAISGGWAAAAVGDGDLSGVEGIVNDRWGG